MKHLMWIWLLGALLCACSSDEDETLPLVTEIEMPSPSEMFSPGDEVTVLAQGFRPGDEIMLDIYWSTTAAERYARGVWGVITERTAKSITFLAPGHYPASTVDVSLRRAGDMMPLGTISVADGQSPKKFGLYGITPSDGEFTSIERIDMGSGAVTEIDRTTSGLNLMCVVNDVGTNTLYGVSARDGSGVGVSYDLTMHYWRDSAPQQYLAVGSVSSRVAYLVYGDNTLFLNGMEPTRTTPPPVMPFWTLPQGLKPGMLARYPFVLGQGGTLLLSADNGDGTFSPVVLFSRLDGYRIQVGDAVQAEALIPFNSVHNEVVNGEIVPSLIGGYVVSKSGVESELRFFDPVEMLFSEPFATVDAPVRSVAVNYDSEGQDMYLLCESGDARRQIRVYDQQKKTWKTLPETVLCEQIVLAR